jgi:hypothetical protein
MSIRLARFLLVASLLLRSTAVVADAPDEAGPPAGLAPGSVLSQQNWRQAEGLLPPEVLEHYKRGEYQNEIADWPLGVYRWQPDFLASTEQNRGRFKLSEQGTIVDKESGQQPSYIYGFPFPDVDPDDPEAGLKILWNSYYGYWYQGNSHNEVRLVWLNPDGIDREAGQDVYFLYYDGQAPQYRMPNPNNFLMQFISTATYPTDLHGTTALTWRYRDSTKRDSNWAYVPALRRVRAVSPANRSDGFLGSDMSQDDGPFFDGKPEDFTWRLVGSTDQYRYADPLSLKGQSNHVWMEKGGWHTIWADDVKSVGFQDPTWKGVAWAPIGPQLAKRPVWILEAIPKDQYYLYGKVQLYVDRETYQGVFNRKFGWKGELLNTYYILGLISQKRVRPDGGEEWLWASNMGYQAAENIKRNRATVSGLLPAGKSPANDRRVPYEPSFFDFMTLQRFGK